MRPIDADLFEVICLEGKSEEFSEGVQWLAEQIDKALTLRVYTVEEVMHKFIDLKYRIKEIEKCVDSNLSAYWWKEGINDSIKEIQKEIDLLKTIQKLEQKTESKDGKTIEDANRDVMERYKKIEQVIDDWEHDGGAMEMSESYWLKKIKGILET